MSKTIPQELLTFKNSVSPSIETMNSTLTTISDKVTEVIAVNEEAKNGIDRYYNSENKASMISSFTNLNNIFNKINTSLDSDLKKMISDSKTIIEKVEKLESLNEEIKKQEEIIDHESAKEQPSNSTISNAREIINSKETEFDTIEKEATTMLNTLKSMDSSLSFTTEFSQTGSDYNTLKSLQTGGHIEEYEFTASNGVTMKYYLYIPEFADGTKTNLPLCLYLHGDSGWSKGALSNSLPKLLADGTLNVPGIVLIPESNSAAWWDDSKGADKNRQAAVELTRKVAADYQCDMTRISACGHSNGGCGVFHMVRDNTDLFSCYVASAGATGKGAGNEKIAEGKVYTWVIHGDKDTVVEYDNNHGTSGKETYERIERVWPEGTSLTTLYGKDHYYQNDVWTMLLDKDGEQVNPMEWLLSTKKYGT